MLSSFPGSFAITYCKPCCLFWNLIEYPTLYKAFTVICLEIMLGLLIVVGLIKQDILENDARSAKFLKSRSMENSFV